MYPSKGGGGFSGQQNYASQQAYGQHPGTGFSGNNPAGPEMKSRQASLISIAQESRNHPAQAAQYGGPYASVYGSATLNSGQQSGGVSGKGAVSSSLQGRAAYPSSLTEPSKYSAGALGSSYSDDYLSTSTRGYAQRGDQFSGGKSSEYAIERRAFGEGAYTGRDLQADPARRYVDSSSLSHQIQADVHDHLDQASLLRQQQIMKAQSLHSGPDIRQAEYLAARAAPIRPGSQDFSSYGGRIDVDPHGLPILGSSQYGAPHSASILGAPRRNIDDLLYAQGSNAGYGVSLPPGRDYISGKGLLGSSASEYQGSIMSRDHLLGVAKISDRNDDRDAYHRELDMREEDRRRELLREREREKERERDRERERERERERRDRERERDLRHGLESRRERTPPRSSRDRRAASAKRDERSRRSPLRRTSPRRATPRRVSPLREASHRHRSPVKEKKREYICKVHPFCLIEAERDYLSINKRYPRLSISPEFTKVVLKWPKEKLHLSIHTPVSFEHDFIEENKSEKGSATVVDSPKSTNIIWNAKVVLMSGVSNDTLDDLCSDKTSDDRLIHFNNHLRFAILKKDHSFMAIGGQQKEALDSVEPSDDGSSLIQTARRYVKDIIQLDLHNCQHWNPFLEIHYNRIGDDGLSSYKEITVLFVPDLLDCLPTLDSWRSMWLAHRKEIAEREKELVSKKEKKSSEKESTQGDRSSSKSKKASSTSKTGKVEDKSGKDANNNKVDDKSPKLEKSSKVAEIKDEGGDPNIGSEEKQKLPELTENPTEKKPEAMVVDDRADEKKALDLPSSDPNVEVKKPTKKKIIRKVVKGKTSDKKPTLATDETVAKHDDKTEKDFENNQKEQKSMVLINNSSAETEKVKTFVRKRVVRKVVEGKSSQEEEDNVSEKKPEQDMENQEEKAKNDKGIAGDAVQTEAKVVGKKRIIRRIIKKKVLPTEDKSGVVLAKNGQAESDTSARKTIKEEDLLIVKEEQDPAESSPTENKLKEEAKKLANVKEAASEKKANEATDNKKASKIDKGPKPEKHGSTNSEVDASKHKDSSKDVRSAKGEGSKQDKDKKSKDSKEKDAKHDTKNRSSKDAKEKVKSDEPPKQPGLFLKAKRTKGSKVRSLSLSLAGLLEYNDKDTDESTFELSLFAESFNEMLQYQMGCRILSFLEKLRKRFVIKHKQRKRQREEKNEKVSEAEAVPGKRPKISKKSDAEKETSKPGKQDSTDGNYDENNSKIEEATQADKSNQENELAADELDDQEEEELEEMYEEYEELDDAATASDAVMEVNEGAVEEVDTESKSEVPANKDEQGKENATEKNTEDTRTKDEKSNSKSKDEKKPSTEKSDSVKDEFVDKELLHAFRFFDYNKVGYIKMDDLRCLLHDLGKFLSHRDVKELVQSALYESSSARDDRIFYKKLVRLKDL